MRLDSNALIAMAHVYGAVYSINLNKWNNVSNAEHAAEEAMRHFIKTATEIESENHESQTDAA